MGIPSVNLPSGRALVDLVPGESGNELARRFGVTRRTIVRWKAGGKTYRTVADRCATELGLHPSEVWENW